MIWGGGLIVLFHLSYSNLLGTINFVSVGKTIGDAPIVVVVFMTTGSIVVVLSLHCAQNIQVVHPMIKKIHKDEIKIV